EVEMNKKLKPCPFCGGEAVEGNNAQVYFDRDTLAEVDYDEPDGFWIECKECGAMAGEFETRQAAIESWNTRTPDIVRCGECIQFEGAECDLGMCDLEGDMVSPRDFCSFGERRG
ncbi:MAG: Lar family restriction alleviation protein, partial [Evtepia sp.]